MSLETEIFKVHSASRERLVHFLMASAGAAIGFSITLQKTLAFSWPDILVIIAICAFALSFWGGVRTSKHTHHLIYVNGKYLQEKSKYESAVHPYIKDIVEKDSFEPIQNRIVRWSVVQTHALVFGAVTLMAWRIASAYPEVTPGSILASLGF